MRKLKWGLWSIVVVSLVVTLGLMIAGPNVVAMHFGATGAADSWSGKLGLLLEPLILAVIAAVCQYSAAHQRQQMQLSALPQLLLGEWRYLGVMVVVLVVFVILQLNQIGWL